MITPTIAAQLFAHFVGDYVLQSEWMAVNKTKNSLAAFVHVCCYTVPFLFLTVDWRILAVVAITHFAIDRWSLAVYVTWLRNHIAPPTWWYGLAEARNNFGARQATPMHLSTWLNIIIDNVMHVSINAFAFAYFA